MYSALVYHLPLLIGFCLPQTQFVWGGFMVFRSESLKCDQYGIMQVSPSKLYSSYEREAPLFEKEAQYDNSVAFLIVINLITFSGLQQKAEYQSAFSLTFRYCPKSWDACRVLLFELDDGVSGLNTIYPFKKTEASLSNRINILQSVAYLQGQLMCLYIVWLLPIYCHTCFCPFIPVLWVMLQIAMHVVCQYKGRHIWSILPFMGSER